MTNKKWFSIFFLLLVLPAAMHSWVLHTHGTLIWNHIDRIFFYNYLWLAFPHLITIALMRLKLLSKSFALINLILLNIAMLILQLILINDRGAPIVWGILYPFLIILCFALSGLFKFLFKIKV